MNLFSFFYKTELPQITVDIHSHLLPGIDDGVKTLKESINIIQKFKRLGYKKIITTPHVISDFYPNTKEIISTKLKEVQTTLKEQNINIIVEASAEYYLDMAFLTLLEEDELIPFMGNYILFETAYISKPIILELAIKRIIDKGFIPVLAHPERYTYLKTLEDFKSLKIQGILLQINIKSLKSRSKHTNSMVKKLIQSGLVDFIGSDVHRMHDVLKMEQILKTKEYQTIIKNNNLLNNY